ncbi:MAG: signal recognition particle receptor subunit alpha, partial [Acidobacteria bacterium]|nr:signal recognition particle receptor subunit alpha [Acidobacteriota bacterium]
MTKSGFFSRLKEAVQKTKENFVGRLEEAMGLRPEIDGALLEDLESILIGADIGVQTTSDLIEKIRDQADRKMIRDAEQVKRLIQTTLLEILNQTSRNGESARAVDNAPWVVFVVGVNGVGKTTTIGKLAYLYRNRGKKPLICASDTFRAAAIDQLEIWARRANTEMIKQASGADPAAVLFDALQAARARGRDPVIVDTAGRL